MLLRVSDRYCGADPVSSPEEQSGAPAARGANGTAVPVAAPERSLVFVVGRSGPPDRAIEEHGGTVVMRLPDGLRVLAVLELDAIGRLRLHSAVALAGRVWVDAPRFESFARFVGLADRPGY